MLNQVIVEVVLLISENSAIEISTIEVIQVNEFEKISVFSKAVFLADDAKNASPKQQKNE